MKISAVYLTCMLALSALIPARAGDGAAVNVGVGHLATLEPKGKETILIKKQGQKQFLLVEPMESPVAGTTMKLGLLINDADYLRLQYLATNRKFVMKLSPVSENNVGKNFLYAAFRTTKRDGTAVEVDLDPEMTGQLTSGTVEVKRMNGDNDREYTFKFTAKVKGLVETYYNASGQQTTTEQNMKVSKITGMVRVTRDLTK